MLQVHHLTKETSISLALSNQCVGPATLRSTQREHWESRKGQYKGHFSSLLASMQSFSRVSLYSSNNSLIRLCQQLLSLKSLPLNALLKSPDGSTYSQTCWLLIQLMGTIFKEISTYLEAYKPKKSMLRNEPHVAYERKCETWLYHYDMMENIKPDTALKSRQAYQIRR